MIYFFFFIFLYKHFESAQLCDMAEMETGSRAHARLTLVCGDWITAEFCVLRSLSLGHLS